MKLERKQPEESNFWQSYSDMMAALLLVFVLIIMFIISKERHSYESMKDDLAVLEADLKEREKEVEDYKRKVNDQQDQIDEIVGIREDIVVKLKDEFDDSGLSISIDPESGAISFDSSVLFDFNKYTLKQDGVEFLEQFFPKYFDAILSEDLVDFIAEVIIEGHTDTNGPYLYNLDLSQKRAFSVAEYCLEEDKMFSGEELEKLRQIVTANGRSFSDPIYDEDGNVDAEASRRVEVKFRLTEEEMMKEVLNALENIE